MNRERRFRWVPSSRCRDTWGEVGSATRRRLQRAVKPGWFDFSKTHARVDGEMITINWYDEAKDHDEEQLRDILPLVAFGVFRHDEEQTRFMGATGDAL